KGGIAPEFAEVRNIVGDDGAAGESGVEGGHAERFVARGSGVDRGAAVEGAQLSFGLRAPNGDATLIDGNLYVGTDGDARQRHGLFGTYDADREWQHVLSEQEDLFAGIEQAADGKNGVIFADVGVEEDGI